jgi:methionyl-tRNA synthetase
MKTKTYVTTAIPYVNAQPHVGFALELVQADAIARWDRRAGATVRLQTGTDENAFKNVEAARAAGTDTQTWVDARAAQFRQLADDLGLDYQRFLRTTEAAHGRAVHTLWRALRREDVYVKAYRGLYCSGCEDFLFEKDLVNGECPEHRQPPVEVEESNYFFRLSAYQEQIERWLTGAAVCIRPEKRRNEILQFVRAGLQDISISRLAARSGGWGVPVPGDPSQVVYVWIDALVNYLTGLGYGTDDGWREWWNIDTRKIHVIGRNVWKFHAVYWPALLLSAGLPLPDELVIHGFLTADGRKIGKSLGNAIAPGDYIRRYGADAVRYFLLRAVPPFDDGDFSAGRFAAVYQADLANGLGNLVSRLLTLAVKSGLEGVTLGETEGTECDKEFERAGAEHRHDEALAALWRDIAALNGEIEEAKPWVELQRGNSAPVRAQVDGWLGRVARIARNVEPFLPATSRKIAEILSAQPLRAAAALFPRV